MHTWWTGLADAPPDEAQALHALGLGFMAARTLHVALELRLFTHLAAGAQTLTQVAGDKSSTIVFPVPVDILGQVLKKGG